MKKDKLPLPSCPVAMLLCNPDGSTVKEDKTREICQYCRFYKLIQSAGWCFGSKQNWTARKYTCKDFERKKK